MIGDALVMVFHTVDDISEPFILDLTNARHLFRRRKFLEADTVLLLCGEPLRLSINQSEDDPKGGIANQERPALLAGMAGEA